MLLVAGVAGGIIYFDRFGQELLPMIHEVFDMIIENSLGEPRPPFNLAIIILLKNSLVAVICFTTAKITRGLLPGFILLFNGLIIGIVAVIVGQWGVSGGELFVQLLPHGIFELSALFMACAIGMKGINKAGWKAMAVPAVMLFIAAFMEVFISPIV